MAWTNRQIEDCLAERPNAGVLRGAWWSNDRLYVMWSVINIPRVAAWARDGDGVVRIEELTLSAHTDLHKGECITQLDLRRHGHAGMGILPHALDG